MVLIDPGDETLLADVGATLGGLDREGSTPLNAVVVCLHVCCVCFGVYSHRDREREREREEQPDGCVRWLNNKTTDLTDPSSQKNIAHLFCCAGDANQNEDFVFVLFFSFSSPSFGRFFFAI
jgi:hypothetical protein